MNKRRKENPNTANTSEALKALVTETPKAVFDILKFPSVWIFGAGVIGLILSFYVVTAFFSFVMHGIWSIFFGLI
jgi:hypothetical protein